MKIRVIGAGVAGLATAYEFARSGCAVEIVERKAAPGLGCSFFAGGMIAPWFEAESARTSDRRNLDVLSGRSLRIALATARML